jgi:hypothetical protein
MLPDPVVLLKIMIMIAIPLIVAGLLFRRGNITLGILTGLVLLGALESYAFWSMDASSQACIRETCLAAGRPPDCEPYLGCTEGKGMLSLLYQGVSVLDGILIAAAGLWNFLRRRAAKGSGASL